MLSSFFFFLMLLQPPRSTLFPYTTLFRSALRARRLRPMLCAQVPAGAFFALRHPSHPELMRVEFQGQQLDRKSTRLNSSHTVISYAVFCLKKKKKNADAHPQTQQERDTTH